MACYNSNNIFTRAVCPDDEEAATTIVETKNTLPS